MDDLFRAVEQMSNDNLQSQRTVWPWRLSALIGNLIATLTLSVLMLSCSSGKVEREHLGINMDSAYMMLTREVDMLVSDSGLTKYRMTSPAWIVYDREDRKEWFFPEGLKMWSVDSLRPGNELVTADTVIFRVPEEEWVLIGNVRIHGLRGERLYTPRLYWQRRDKRLYSHDSTYFYTEGRELRGSRFEAADDLSWYSIYNNRGNFEVREKPADQAPESTTPTSPPLTNSSQQQTVAPSLLN